MNNPHQNARTTPHSRALIADRRAAGQSVASIAADFGISTRTVFKWLARHREGGRAALVNRASIPARQRGLGEREQALIGHLRREHRLTGAAIARRLDLARATVAQVWIAVIQAVGLAVGAWVWRGSASLLLALVAWDVASGALAFSTPTTSAFFASKPRSVHVAFVGVHALHVVAAAWCGGESWGWSAAVYATTVSGIVLVRAAPDVLATPVAFGVVVLGSSLISTLSAWPAFVPVWLLKLVWAFGLLARRSDPR